MCVVVGFGGVCVSECTLCVCGIFVCVVCVCGVFVCGVCEV